MPNPLPFEHDSPELLEAAALAMRGIDPAPARTQPLLAPAARSAPAYAVWRRESAGDAPVLHASGVTPEAETVDSRLDLSAVHTGLSAEALSREIERDARRYEAN